MKVNGRHPDQLLKVVAEHFREPVVRMEDHSIFGDRYRFERRFSETSESFFGFAEYLLDSLPLGDFVLELPHHCLKVSGTPFYPLLQIFVQLENFVFRELADRDIFRDPGDPIDRAGRVMYRKRPVPNPANSALRTDDSIFLIIESVHLFLQGGIENFHPVFGVNRIEPGTPHDPRGI